MIKTVLTDDHKIFCEGLARLLGESNEFEIVGIFHKGADLLQRIEDLNPDLVVLDIDLQDHSGIDLIMRIKSRTSAKVVMLSMHEESIYSEEAAGLGADGYLSKSVDSSKLVESLLDIYEGMKVFPSAKRMTEQAIKSPLSARESQILRELAKGKTSEDIAREINLSQLTIKTHRRNMMRKLNVTNSAELISTAFQMGYL